MISVKTTSVNKYAFVLLTLTLTSLPSAARSKKNVPAGQVIDSGTFDVFIKGKRVASEKFEITQTPDMSVAKAELRIDDDKTAQNAELQLAPNGDLIHYKWSESGKGEAVVEPKDEFLVEHVTLSEPQKRAEQPFVLPVSTLVMDDGFFSQRELLLWRYLATQCQMKPGDKGCSLASQQFGVIIPRQQTSSQITVEFKGSQKVNIKGTDLDLQRFELHGDGYDWTVWMDAGYKIQKIAIAQESTEVYRE
jgi:hypothetical protein